jgi:hypothetical protein
VRAAMDALVVVATLNGDVGVTTTFTDVVRVLFKFQI